MLRLCYDADVLPSVLGARAGFLGAVRRRARRSSILRPRAEPPREPPPAAARDLARVARAVGAPRHRVPRRGADAARARDAADRLDRRHVADARPQGGPLRGAGAAVVVVACARRRPPAPVAAAADDDEARAVRVLLVAARLGAPSPRWARSVRSRSRRQRALAARPSTAASGATARAAATPRCLPACWRSLGGGGGGGGGGSALPERVAIGTHGFVEARPTRCRVSPPRAPPRPPPSVRTWPSAPSSPSSTRRAPLNALPTRATCAARPASSRARRRLCPIALVLCRTAEVRSAEREAALKLIIGATAPSASVIRATGAPRAVAGGLGALLGGAAAAVRVGGDGARARHPRPGWVEGAPPPPPTPNPALRGVAVVQAARATAAVAVAALQRLARAARVPPRRSCPPAPPTRRSC